MSSDDRNSDWMLWVILSLCFTILFSLDEDDQGDGLAIGAALRDLKRWLEGPVQSAVIAVVTIAIGVLLAARFVHHYRRAFRSQLEDTTKDDNS